MDETNNTIIWFSHRLVSFSIEVRNSESGVEQVQKVCLNSNKDVKTQTRTPAGSVLTIGKRISNFLDGHDDNFKDLKLDFTGLSSFQIQVLEAARKIQRGTVVTYSQLAEMAGCSNAVRATASVMRANRFPLIIPCHRVVRKNGYYGGYCGYQNGPMFELKQLLQQIEK